MNDNREILLDCFPEDRYGKKYVLKRIFYIDIGEIRFDIKDYINQIKNNIINGR